VPSTALREVSLLQMLSESNHIVKCAPIPASCPASYLLANLKLALKSCCRHQAFRYGQASCVLFVQRTSAATVGMTPACGLLQAATVGMTPA